jgi:pimeloyl-ACP methyl ester carboxylesterase
MFGAMVRWRERELARKEDPHRTVDPMDVGLELLVEHAAADKPLAALRRYSLEHRAGSGSYFEPGDSAANYERRENGLSFDSPIPTETPANGRVVCRLFEAATRERAVVLIPHWNADLAGYDRFARFLRRAGITALVMSLPYHDRQCVTGQRLATYMVSSNLGRTIRSCRQAVLEARLAIAWLERRGSHRIGVVGISLGSSIASIAAAHDPRVTAAALILTAGQFGEVVWTGRATRHIRLALEGRVSLAELNEVWSVISPISYVPRLAERRTPVLVLSARADEVFLPYLTEQFIASLREWGVPLRRKICSCGHYTTGTLPFSAIVLHSTIRFLREYL